MDVIEIEGLRRTYRMRRRGRSGPRSHAAVDGLDLCVPTGGVFGFLGPNGSGKTTTIRCLLGLVRPTSGRMQLLGGAVPAALPETLRKVGAIVEGPALFPTFSGRQNLRLLAAIDRIGHRRVDEVLDIVGLAERADDEVRKYSLGMRQRLGLGAALLKDPELLVLDEPANGLDPAGMRDVRELMRRLADEGRTVFVSSHLLSEIQQTCDRVAIISHGRTVVQGTIAEVLAGAGAGVAALRVEIEDATAERLGLAANTLSRAGFTVGRDGAAIVVDGAGSRAAEVNRALAHVECWPVALRADERSLEDLFLTLTGEPAQGPSLESDRGSTHQAHGSNTVSVEVPR